MCARVNLLDYINNTFKEYAYMVINGIEYQGGLKYDEVENTPEFINAYPKVMRLVEDEIDNPLLRDTSEMVIIGSPKEAKKRIVHDYDKIKEEHYFQGIISSHNIMGYIDENHRPDAYDVP